MYASIVFTEPSGASETNMPSWGKLTMVADVAGNARNVHGIQNHFGGENVVLKECHAEATPNS